MRTLILIIAAFQVYGKDVLIPEGSFSYPGSCYPVNCWRHYVGKYLVPLPDGQTECSDTIDVHNVKVQGYEHDWKNVCQATVRYHHRGPKGHFYFWRERGHVSQFLSTEVIGNVEL